MTSRVVCVLAALSLLMPSLSKQTSVSPMLFATALCSLVPFSPTPLSLRTMLSTPAACAPEFVAQQPLATSASSCTKLSMCEPARSGERSPSKHRGRAISVELGRELKKPPGLRQAPKRPTRDSQRICTDRQ